MWGRGKPKRETLHGLSKAIGKVSIGIVQRVDGFASGGTASQAMKQLDEVMGDTLDIHEIVEHD